MSPRWVAVRTALRTLRAISLGMVVAGVHMLSRADTGSQIMAAAILFYQGAGNILVTTWALGELAQLRR